MNLSKAGSSLESALQMLEHQPDVLSSLEMATDIASAQKLLDEANINLSIRDLAQHIPGQSGGELAEADLELVVAGLKYLAKSNLALADDWTCVNVVC